MDILKFETAARLKELGFKQPEPKPGQFWYSKYGEYNIIVEYYHDIRGTVVEYVERGGASIETTLNFAGNFIFCPSIADFLQEIPDCKIYKHGNFWFAEFSDWQLRDVTPNAVLAAAWIKIKS